MHHSKRMARSVAWRDPNNPFSKNMFSGKRTSSALSQMERGQRDDDDLIRVTTEPTSGRTRTKDVATHRSTQNQTAPSAVSRRRENEPGDDIGYIPEARSPEGSIKDFSNTLPNDVSPTTQTKPAPQHQSQRTTENSLGDEIPKKKNFLTWISSWSSSDSNKSQNEKHPDDDDDDNGKNKVPFTPWNQIKNTIFNSKINILLIMCPVGIALHFAKVDPRAIFVVNFIAIIPLAAMLSFATEEIALRVGEVLGGLLNASFGNAVELIVSIIALVKGEIIIVQTSLIGSILSNLLLVLGMCFFAGGVNRIEQEFNMTVAQTAASLLFLAVSSLLIPTAFELWAVRNPANESSNNGQTEALTPSGTPVLEYGVEQLSLATAVLLLFVYALFLFFQLKSHNSMYTKPSKKNEKRDLSKHTARVKKLVPGKMRRRSHAPDVAGGASADPALAGSNASVRSSRSSGSDEADAPEVPQLSLWVAIFTLAASTVLVALNAEFLVDSIDQITCTGGINKTFVGLILLPIVGNAAEHATSVTVAIKDKMDLAIGVAVGSSMQIALLVLPFMVVLGQIIGKDDMTLYFDGFQLAILFVTVLLVNYLIQDGKSHWLEGCLLMILYVIIAVAAWYYPSYETPGQTCSG